ncbi:MAG: amidohydrolase [Chloroflexi bacterium]|nr:amidohydrolase [Chloroflexota bacterium]
MIIDAHVHIKGGDAYRRELDPDDTIRYMDQAGVDKSCVFSICLPSRESNEMTRRAITGRENRLIPFAHMVPEERSVGMDALRRAIEDWGFRGIKLHFGEVKGEITDELFLPILELGAGYDLPILLCCAHKPEFPDRWADAVPEAKIIIPHLGSSRDQDMNWRFFDVAKRHDNVWLDTSFTSGPWMIREAYHALGADKLIWGSDGGGDYNPPLPEMAKVKVWEFPAADYRRIMGGNILELLGGSV